MFPDTEPEIFGQTPPWLVSSKEMVYDLLARGWCGNTCRVWPDPVSAVRELESSDQIDSGPRLFGVRCTIPDKRHIFRAGMFFREAHDYFHQCARVVPKETLRFCEGPDADRIKIQGELRRTVNHWDLTWTDERGLPNRPYLWKNPRFTSGLAALHVLKSRLDEADYDDLMELFSIYDNRPGKTDCVVEFTMVDYAIGTMGRRMIVWEVRHF